MEVKNTSLEDNIHENKKRMHTEIKMSHFIKTIYTVIDKLYQRETKEFKYEPTLFSDDSKEYIEKLKIAYKIRQKQMKEGILAQRVIGNFIGWKDLGVGHSSGLDCCKKDNSIIMEVKNKYNTCNSGSLKAILDKLSKYKKKNPETRCVLAIVNPKLGDKKLCKKITHNGVEIEIIQGKELFKLVFTVGNINYSELIIKIVKDYISKY